MLEYNVTKAEIQTAGTGYVVNDVLTADLDLEDAKFKVTAVKPLRYSVTAATASGTMSGYKKDEIIGIIGAEGDIAASLKVEDVTSSLYILNGITWLDGTSGYVTGETVTIPAVSAGDPDIVITLTATDGVITGVSADEAYSVDFTGNMTGTYTSADYIYTGSGTGLVLTLDCMEIELGGSITGLEVVSGGSFASNISGSVSSDNIVYAGEGTGLELSVTASGNVDVGAITEITIEEGGENSTDTISNPVSVTGGTGSGAKLTLTLSLPFEKVEVADVPGIIPKPATDVEIANYDVPSVDVTIDYNTTFTREYPVQG